MSPEKSSYFYTDHPDLMHNTVITTTYKLTATYDNVKVIV